MFGNFGQGFQVVTSLKTAFARDECQHDQEQMVDVDDV